VEENPRSENNVFQRIEFDESGKLLPGNYVADTDDFENIKANAKEIQEQAYIEGFEKGERDGLESAKASLEPVVQHLSQSIEALENAKKELHLRTEREAVELALAIAEKIVSHEVQTNREVVLSVVEEALKKVVDRKNIKIRVAPPDFHFLNNAKVQIPDLEELFEKATFEEDKSIVNGGCVIETNLGDIDARIEKQFQAVEDAFRSEIKKLRLGG
jgi:flagellar assembly protein FliH